MLSPSVWLLKSIVSFVSTSELCPKCDPLPCTNSKPKLKKLAEGKRKILILYPNVMNCPVHSIFVRVMLVRLEFFKYSQSQTQFFFFCKNEMLRLWWWNNLRMCHEYITCVHYDTGYNLVLIRKILLYFLSCHMTWQLRLSRAWFSFLFFYSRHIAFYTECQGYLFCLCHTLSNVKFTSGLQFYYYIFYK